MEVVCTCLPVAAPVVDDVACEVVPVPVVVAAAALVVEDEWWLTDARVEDETEDSIDEEDVSGPGRLCATIEDELLPLKEQPEVELVVQ